MKVSSLFALGLLKSQQDDPRSRTEAGITAKDYDPVKLFTTFNLSVPVDHFHNDSKYEPHVSDMFPLRYWFDSKYYKPGGPVLVLAAGETDAIERLPVLQKGIINILARATNGIAVVLEHRYYGQSFPVSNLSVHNLRFLDTQQALADTAYFARNIKFPGLEERNLSPDYVPWIVYGGSYAGAFAAFLRVLYPEVFWGAISSSGVPMAIVDYWQYDEAFRRFGPRDCVETMQDIVQFVDSILLDEEKSRKFAGSLKTVFGFPNVSDNTAFASVATTGGGGAWQGRNWDPDINVPTLTRFCANVTTARQLYPQLSERRHDLQQLKRLVDGEDMSEETLNKTLNYIGYLNLTMVSPCSAEGTTQDQCFVTPNMTYYRQEDLKQTWRLWEWQVCTQWGYFGSYASVPPSIRPMGSRLIGVEETSQTCRYAFNRTAKDVDVDAINQYGGFNISYPRLAFLDGEQDPWRWAGVHAPGLSRRKNTLSEPFMLIPGAVHHWDENGLFRNQTSDQLPPPPVRAAQLYETKFVKHWVAEYHARGQRLVHQSPALGRHV